MSYSTLSELKEALKAITGNPKEVQKKREALLEENIALIGLGKNDTPQKLDHNRRIPIDDLETQLGELGRILTVLPELQMHQVDWSNATLVHMVDRGCQLAIALMSHSAEQNRITFALEYASQLTLCSDVRYFQEFVKLLPEGSRYNFTLNSDTRVKQRMQQIEGAQNTWRVAANFQVSNLLPPSDKARYIHNFMNEVTVNIDWGWANQGKIPESIINSTPNVDYLIDLLAIIPEDKRLTVAKELVISLGNRIDYHRPNLQSLERILDYLTSDQAKSEFTTYFKKQVPLLAEDIKTGSQHTNPFIREIFSDDNILPFVKAMLDPEFQTQRRDFQIPKELLDELRKPAQSDNDEVNQNRQVALIPYIDGLAKQVKPDQDQWKADINNLRLLEELLFTMLIADQYKVRRPLPSNLDWLAERAAYLYVAELSFTENKALFAAVHIRNVIWTDMWYFMKVVELLPENDRFDFIISSCKLPDTELANAKNLLSIVGLMAAIPLLPESQQEKCLNLFKEKIALIDWKKVAEGNFPLISADPNYLVGALFVIEDPKIRLQVALRLITDVKTLSGFASQTKLSQASLERIMQALKSYLDRQTFLESYIKNTPLTPEEEKQARNVLNASVEADFVMVSDEIPVARPETTAASASQAHPQPQPRRDNLLEQIKTKIGSKITGTQLPSAQQPDVSEHYRGLWIKLDKKPKEQQFAAETTQGVQIWEEASKKKGFFGSGQPSYWLFIPSSVYASDPKQASPFIKADEPDLTQIKRIGTPGHEAGPQTQAPGKK